MESYGIELLSHQLHIGERLWHGRIPHLVRYMGTFCKDKLDLLLVVWALTLALILAGVSSAPGVDSQVFWGNPVNNFSVGLAVSNTVYDLRKPVLVVVHVRNDASAPALLGQAYPIRCVLSFDASDGSRRDVEKEKPDCDAPHVAGISVPPGGVETVTVDLRDYLRITNSGKFVLTAKRLLFWPTVALSGNAMIEVVFTNSSSITPESKGRPAPSAGSAIVSNTPGRNPVPAQNSTPVAAQATASAPSAQPATSGSVTNSRHLTPAQKIGVGMVAALIALLLLIIFRAKARQKRLPSENGIHPKN